MFYLFIGLLDIEIEHQSPFLKGKWNISCILVSSISCRVKDKKGVQVKKNGREQEGIFCVRTHKRKISHAFNIQGMSVLGEYNLRRTLGDKPS